ncbi:hypothetical protein M0R45_034492 [Rubus argutus]|uniref:Uncharacterized protein n=1 Tax=Rubus argutus TaxID=59490 RepID=A0AAW1VUN0_RUBAR
MGRVVETGPGPPACWALLGLAMYGCWACGRLARLCGLLGLGLPDLWLEAGGDTTSGSIARLRLAAALENRGSIAAAFGRLDPVIDRRGRSGSVRIEASRIGTCGSGIDR